MPRAIEKDAFIVHETGQNVFRLGDHFLSNVRPAFALEKA
jgi:hypothetical protein